MILEHALLDVRPGEEQAFEAAMAEAPPLIAASPGFLGMEVRPSIETPGRYLLLVRWRSVEDHDPGFRGSERYQRWKALLHHFYEPFPTVEHFAEPVTTRGAPASLRLELFVGDIGRSLDFYGRVLGFETGPRSGDYVALRLGSAEISLNAQAALSPDHPVRGVEGEPAGRFVETVLAVEDIDAVYRRVVASGWPIRDEIVDRPWGLRDFRLIDPDGLYLRVTSVRS